MKLTDYFDRVFVINLPYKADRRLRIEKHLVERGLVASESIIWVRAIAGDYCDAPDWFQAGNGAWGCLQSHFRIVQDAIMEGLDSYCVLEDDAIFSHHAAHLLDRLMEDAPDDWGQIYLGGQHLKHPNSLGENSFVASCSNVNRTHAYCLHSRSFRAFQKHIMHAPDYIRRGSWHLDHQLGIAHQRSKWPTYAPIWWLAGQAEGSSNISGSTNPELWWQYSKYSVGLPFIHFIDGVPPNYSLHQYVHFGNNLKPNTNQDIGLDECVDSPTALRKWLAMIAIEALDMHLLPGIAHPQIPYDFIKRHWKAGVIEYYNADFKSLIDYPFNGLFSDLH